MFPQTVGQRDYIFHCFGAYRDRLPLAQAKINSYILLSELPMRLRQQLFCSADMFAGTEPQQGAG